MFWEEYAAADGPGRIGVVGDWLLGPTVIAHGTMPAAARFLPRILDGTERWCQGYSEPDAGSDLASLRTRAELDGDQWVINGHKIWTSVAHLAHWAFVLCRTGTLESRHRGISYLLVPMDQPGVEIRPIRDLTGGDTDFCEVFFTTRAHGRRERGGGGRRRLGRRHEHRLPRTRGLDRRLPALVRPRARADHRRKPASGAEATTRRFASGWPRRGPSYQILRWSVLRTLSSVRAGNHSPVTNVYKVLWSSFHQRLGELAIDVLGLDGQLSDAHRTLVRSPVDVLLLPGRDDLRRLAPDPAEHHRGALAWTAPRTQELESDSMTTLTPSNSRVNFPVFDADNHYYEALDAFTRHLDPKIDLLRRFVPSTYCSGIFSRHCRMMRLLCLISSIRTR